MASTEQSGGGTSAPVDRLKDELTQLGTALAQKLVDRLGQKIEDVTKNLAGAASEAGGKALHPKELAKSAVKGATPGGGGGGGGGAAKAVTGKVKEAVPGMGGGGGDGGGDGDGEGRKPGEKKVTTIIETIEVGMPLRTVYDHWTQWENFPDFMKGVVSVDQDDEDRTVSDWKLKIAWSNRSWKATVEEQIPDQRIVWSSEGDKATTRGVVTFHEVAPRLTRVVVVVEYTPVGFFEKTANLWRAQGRRLRLDLKHFQRMVTIAPDEEIEGWRGTIHDGEVVTSHEEAMEQERGGGEGEQSEPQAGNGEEDRDGGNGEEDRDGGNGEDEQDGGNGEEAQEGR